MPFTSTYVGSLALTLYASLVLQSYILVLFFALVQACAVAWYLLSYVPGGARLLKLVTSSALRLVSALCCRSPSSTSQILASWGGGSSTSMLPL